MDDYRLPEKGLEKAVPAHMPKERSSLERRKQPSRGFACMSMVGWICRRELLRRKNDSDRFGNGEKPG